MADTLSMWTHNRPQPESKGTFLEPEGSAIGQPRLSLSVFTPMPSDGEESDGGNESDGSESDKDADSEDSIHTQRKHLAPPVAMYMTPNHKAPKRRVGQAVSPVPLNEDQFLPTPENPPKRKRSLIDKVLRLHNFINTPSARMVRSRFAPLHLNEEDTIAFKLLGKTCASCVNHLYRRRSLMVLSRVAHALGIIASGLTMASLIPSSYAYLTLLSWPRALVLFGVCNADLLKILIQDGNVLYLTTSVVLLTWSWMTALADDRKYAMLFLSPNLLLASFCDALPAASRIKQSAGFIAMYILTVVFIFANIVFNFAEIRRDDIEIVGLNFSNITFAMSACGNLLFFGSKNIHTLLRHRFVHVVAGFSMYVCFVIPPFRITSWQQLTHQNCLVLIKSRVENVELTTQQANDETKVYDSRKGDSQLIKAKHFHRRQSRSGASRGSGLRKSLSRSFSHDSVVYPELESIAPSMTGLIDMRAEARPSFAPRASIRERREGISLYGSDVLEILDRNEPLSFPPIQDVDIPAIIPIRPSSFDYSTPPPNADSVALLPGTLPPSPLLREHTSLLAQVALIVDPGPAVASTDRHSTANMPLGQQV